MIDIDKVLKNTVKKGKVMIGTTWLTIIPIHQRLIN